MVEDKKKQEDIDNGLIDPKTIELNTKFKEAIDSGKSINTLKGSLIIIWESMTYNFGKIRVTQLMNTQAIQKMGFEQKVLEHRIEEVSVKQSEFRPKVEKRLKTVEEDKIKNKAQWGMIATILGGTGTLIVMILALLQLASIIGGF